MRDRRKNVLFVHIDDSGCINVEIDEVCATDDDRSEQETIVYTVTQRDNIYSQPVLEPDYGNVLADGIRITSQQSTRHLITL